MLLSWAMLAAIIMPPASLLDPSAPASALGKRPIDSISGGQYSWGKGGGDKKRKKIYIPKDRPDVNFMGEGADMNACTFPPSNCFTPHSYVVFFTPV